MSDSLLDMPSVYSVTGIPYGSFRFKHPPPIVHPVDIPEPPRYRSKRCAGCRARKRSRRSQCYPYCLACSDHLYVT